MTDEVIIPMKEPCAVDVEAGKIYSWCRCGRSKEQPFCDGSHQGTTFKPINVKAEQSETVYFCGCKTTKNAPWCDGSHNNLD